MIFVLYIYFIMYYVQDVCCKLLFGCRLNYSKYYQEKMQNIFRARIILWGFILAIFSMSVYVYKTIKKILLFVWWILKIRYISINENSWQKYVKKLCKLSFLLLRQIIQLRFERNILVLLIHDWQTRTFAKLCQYQAFLVASIIHYFIDDSVFIVKFFQYC